MCGICGIYHSEMPVDEEVLMAMTRCMEHRGPDDEGFFVDKNIGLGFRRLSIVDIEHGHQPLTNEDGTIWIVFNGEIYNYASLRTSLVERGHKFQSVSDTEVIVHLYEEYGIDFLSRISGMFAIAIADLRDRALYLARDHFGIKPLYYARADKRWLFASDIRSILTALPNKPTINAQAVWDYLTFQYIPQTRGIFEGIHKLPPAHYLKIGADQQTLHRYWTPEFHHDASRPFSYYVEGVRYYLENAVQRHLQGSVPLGSFLSGGVDSNAIAAIMKKYQPLNTFSIAIEDSSPSMQELRHAEEIANILKTNHHSVTISRQAFMRDLPQAILALEEPLGDPSAIALYYVAQLARQHVTVVLSGEGADEIFGGYPIYHEPKSLSAFNYLPMSVRTALGEFAGALPEGLKGRDFLLRGSKPLERRFLGNIKVYTEQEKHALLQTDRLPKTIVPSYGITDEVYQRYQALDDISRMQLVDLNTWLPGDILLKADKMTMAHSLELRVPYLDRTLFEFAASIPVRYRIQGREGKRVLREAVRPLLTDEIVHRPKLGFPVPYREWVKTYAGDIWDILSTGSLQSWFHLPYVETLLRDHITDAKDNGRKLWNLWMLCLWADQIVGKTTF